MLKNGVKAMKLEIVNKLFSTIIYSVRIYDAKPIRDYVKLKIWGDLNSEIIFPIEIARKPMPILTFKEGDRLIDKITIVTKV